MQALGSANLAAFNTLALSSLSTQAIGAITPAQALGLGVNASGLQASQVPYFSAGVVGNLSNFAIYSLSSAAVNALTPSEMKELQPSQLSYFGLNEIKGLGSNIPVSYTHLTLPTNREV